MCWLVAKPQMSMTLVAQISTGFLCMSCIKVVSYSVRVLGLELIQVSRQSAGRWLVINPAAGCHYFLLRLQLPSQPKSIKPGFHYPSSWPEFTGRVDGPWTPVHFLTPELTARVEECQKCTRVDGPSTRVHMRVCIGALTPDVFVHLHMIAEELLLLCLRWQFGIVVWLCVHQWSPLHRAGIVLGCEETASSP